MNFKSYLDRAQDVFNACQNISKICPLPNPPPPPLAPLPLILTANPLLSETVLVKIEKQIYEHIILKHIANKSWELQQKGTNMYATTHQRSTQQKNRKHIQLHVVPGMTLPEVVLLFGPSAYSYKMDRPRNGTTCITNNT